MCPRSSIDPSFQQGFLAHMARTASGCLEWQGYKSRKGYGQVSVDGKVQRAHRIAWLIAHGPIPDGLDCLHHCDNPSCCEASRPGHLFLGTRADNNHDKIAKGRDRHGVCRGEQNGRAKLTDADVLEIRCVYVRSSREFGQPALARRFDVDSSVISDIVRRIIWTRI